MKCPICEQQGLTTDVLNNPVSVIRFGTSWNPFLISDIMIDEHYHGLTGYIFHMVCTNYHMFSIPEKIKCDSCDYDYSYEKDEWSNFVFPPDETSI